MSQVLSKLIHKELPRILYWSMKKWEAKKSDYLTCFSVFKNTFCFSGHFFSWLGISVFSWKKNIDSIEKNRSYLEYGSWMNSLVERKTQAIDSWKLNKQLWVQVEFVEFYSQAKNSVQCPESWERTAFPTMSRAASLVGCFVSTLRKLCSRLGLLSLILYLAFQ